MRRSEFLSSAGKLALGASGLGLLSGGLGAATPAPRRAQQRIARAASSKVKEIAVVEQAFAPFFTENFQIPLTQYLKKDQKGWTQTFGNENNTVPTGINLLNEFAAANDAILILSTGDDMTAWQESVKKVVAEGSLFINHSTQGVAGATQNVLSRTSSRASTSATPPSTGARSTASARRSSACSATSPTRRGASGRRGPGTRSRRSCRRRRSPARFRRSTRRPARPARRTCSRRTRRSTS